jgi:hypothetical protein
MNEQMPPAVTGPVEPTVMQHTPGPWNVNFKKFSEVRAENGAVIAECKKLTGLVNLQANARLVAAAPDLLAALGRLTQQCARLRLPGQPKSDAEKNAEAVLARAGAA